MFWRKKIKAPVELPLIEPPEHEDSIAVDASDSEDSIDWDCVQTEPEPIKPLAEQPALKREMKKMDGVIDVKKSGDPKTDTYYALYEYDNEYYAIGPFNEKLLARCWLSGFLKGTEDSDYHVIGITSDLIDFGDVNYEAPNLGK